MSYVLIWDARHAALHRCPGAPMPWASIWPWPPVAVTPPPSRSSWHPWGETTRTKVKGFEKTQGSFRRLWQGGKRQTWIKKQHLQEKIWNYCQKKIIACLFCTVKRKKQLELDPVQASGSNFKKEWKLCDKYACVSWVWMSNFSTFPPRSGPIRHWLPWPPRRRGELRSTSWISWGAPLLWSVETPCDCRVSARSESISTELAATLSHVFPKSCHTKGFTSIFTCKSFVSAFRGSLRG